MNDAAMNTMPKEIVVTQQISGWTPLYTIKDNLTSEILYYGENKGFWIPNIVVYSHINNVKQIAFSIKFQGLFPLSYAVKDGKDNLLASLVLENFLASSWRIVDINANTVANLERTQFFPSKEYQVYNEERVICNLRQPINFFAPKICVSYSQEEALTIDNALLLSVTILLLYQGNSGGGGGGG